MTFCVLDTATTAAGFLTTALMFVGAKSFGVLWCADQRIKNYFESGWTLLSNEFEFCLSQSCLCTTARWVDC